MLPSSSRIDGWARVFAMIVTANDCVIAHLLVERLTMSRDNGGITFRAERAAVGTGGDLCAAGDACWLSAGEGGHTRPSSGPDDSSCDCSWPRQSECRPAGWTTSRASGAGSRCYSPYCQSAATH